MVESIGNPAGIGQGTGLGLRDRDRDGIGLRHYRLRTSAKYLFSKDTYVAQLLAFKTDHVSQYMQNANNLFSAERH